MAMVMMAGCIEQLKIERREPILKTNLLYIFGANFYKIFYFPPTIYNVAVGSRHLQNNHCSSIAAIFYSRMSRFHSNRLENNRVAPLLFLHRLLLLLSKTILFQFAVTRSCVISTGESKFQPQGRVRVGILRRFRFAH
jgi:hypothetical protein